jgi:hypothetical protein
MNKPLTLRLALPLGIAALLAQGCLNNTGDCFPSGNCTAPAPTTASLILRLSTDAENPSIPLEVYWGDVTDGNLYFRDTAYGDEVSYTVDVNQRFSAVARYKRGGFTILAVDGDRTDLSSSDDCGDTCYDVDNATLNLRLAE